MAVASAQAPVSGRSLAMQAHFASPLAELGEEQLVGHGDAELAALHGFGTFVGGFELGIHPLVAEEAGAVFGDAVTAHEADGFAHHLRAVAGVPQLAGGAEHVGHAIEDGVLHQGIFLELGTAGRAGTRWHPSAPGAWLSSGRCLPVRPRAAMISAFCFSSGSSSSKTRGGFEARERHWPRRWPRHPPGGGRRPALLQAEFVARRARGWRWIRRGSVAVVADDGLDGAESSLAEVMMATVTRVRRKTASMTSPWLYLGTMTPSFTV